MLESERDYAASPAGPFWRPCARLDHSLEGVLRSAGSGIQYRRRREIMPTAPIKGKLLFAALITIAVKSWPVQSRGNRGEYLRPLRAREVTWIVEQHGL